MELFRTYFFVVFLHNSHNFHFTLNPGQSSLIFSISETQPSYRFFRSSRPEVLLKIYSKFTGEHPCRGAISIKLLCASLCFNPLSANFTKWPNTLKQFVGQLPTNCFSVFDHFVGLALKGLIKLQAWNNFIEITLQHGCSPVNLLHIFRTPFVKNTSGLLLLFFKTFLKFLVVRKLVRQFLYYIHFLFLILHSLTLHYIHIHLKSPNIFLRFYLFNTEVTVKSFSEKYVLLKFPEIPWNHP